MQAAFGPTDAHLQTLAAEGYRGWLQSQRNLPIEQTHAAWLAAQGYADPVHRATFNGVDNSLWRALIGRPDVLRMRMALALSEIFVVSMQGLTGPWRGWLAAHYMDLLEAHAFGSYRALLEAVTLSPAMGRYLNLRGNRRGDPVTGRLPDENYAREVLQLFSVGLVALAPDGTPLRDPDSGRLIDTYGPEDIAGLARVFTGWVDDRFDRNDPAWTGRPMVLQPARHEPGPKRFLGLQIPAGTSGTEALRRALDHIAAHPNVPPFFSRQLIQRLVSSNPSAEYVRRVAQVFVDNGHGVRGDLAAVLEAVLLDPEARAVPDVAQVGVLAVAGTPGLRGLPSAPQGLLREPLVRFLHWARTFGADTAEVGPRSWRIGNTSNTATSLGQSPLRAPSVFNFFRPGYVPPNTALAQGGWVAPEFQLVHETSVAAWVNAAQQFVANGLGDVKPNYQAEWALAGDVPALVQRLNARLTASTLPPATVALITQAVETIPSTGDRGVQRRVWAAVHLVLCTPEFLVQT